MPKLRGASPVGRDEGGYSYAAQSVGRGGLDPPHRRRGACGHGQPRGGAITINWAARVLGARGGGNHARQSGHGPARCGPAKHDPKRHEWPGGLMEIMVNRGTNRWQNKTGGRETSQRVHDAHEHH